MDDFNRIRNAANAHYIIHSESANQLKVAYPLIYEYLIDSREISMKEKTKAKKNILL